MSTSAEKADAMEDLQFNASLDALLASENLGNASYQSDPAGGENAAIENDSGPASAVVPQQGLLSAQGSVSTSSYAGLPYALPASLQPSTPYTTTQYAPMQLAPASQAAAAATGMQPIMPSSLSATSKQPAHYLVGSVPSIETLTAGRKRDTMEVSEDEEDGGKRRQDRNMREQQRSQKITQQIDHLRDVLSAANIQFKPDKFSTLVTVADYIKQLQARSSLLDQEQKKLLDTISSTNEVVNGQYVPASTTGENPPGSGQLEDGDENGTLFVPNVDYKSAFIKCGVPLAVLSIDGRFLDCNHGFEQLTGHTRKELLPGNKVGLIATEPAVVISSEGEAVSTVVPGEGGETTRNLSLFNILSRTSMEGVFRAMSDMLKNPPVPATVAESDPSNQQDYWMGPVTLSKDESKKMQMNVSLVRSTKGRAKFFDCSLTPL